MSTKKFPVTNLDFDELKAGLTTYLQGQERFKDYDYEGSNMNVLLDVLSYNTFQNNFYTNMAISEMFLDSAQLRDSVISHAKELNYLPSSRSSAKAVVDVTLNNSSNPTFVIMPAKTKFHAVCGFETYTFYTKESVTITPSNGEYRFNNLDIYEGEYITELFDPSASTTQRYLILNQNIDIKSLEVRIIENDFSEEYIYSSDLYNRVSTDKSFFLQAHTENSYEIFFGNDVFGVEPKAGSIIEVTYRVTVGEEGNGITSFEAAGSIQGFGATISLRTASRGGAERESLKSIRYFAPKAIQVQERAVVGKDYEILLKRSFPEVRTVAVYGGETLDPPQYGRIIISVALQDFSNISTNSREIYRQFLKERSALTVEPIVVPAEFAYFDIKTNISYNTKNTIKSTADIRGLVQSAILDYSDNNLGDFKNTLRFSKLTAMIDDSGESILSNETDLRLILEITPVPDIPDNYSIRFGNPLFVQRDQAQLSTTVQSVETAVVSSVFVYQGQDAYLRDNGNGTLDILSNAGSTVQFLERNVGTVNYETGLVGIDGFVVDSYVGTAIKFYGNIRTDDIKTPSEHVSFIRPEDIIITITSVSE
jgi:hypothetical protein